MFSKESLCVDLKEVSFLFHNILIQGHLLTAALNNSSINAVNMGLRSNIFFITEQNALYHLL